MKRIMLLVILLLAFLNVPFVKAVSNTGNAPVSVLVDVPSTKDKKLSNEEIKRLTDRLAEIIRIDKSKLSKIEKRVLRKEVRDIKQKLDVGYIYISGTAILIIILILLLI